MTAMDLASLAERVHGELFARHRNAVVTGAAPLSDAKPGYITLIDDEKHIPKLQSSSASAVVTPKSFDALELPQIVVKNPHDAFAKICQIFRPTHVVQRSFGIHPSACVHPSAEIDSDCFIDAFVFVDDDCVVGAGTHLHRGVTLMPGCHVGRDCQLYPGVVLYPGTILGDRVTLHAGVVLGAHGFGYRMVEGTHQPTSQLGWVEIEDDVEIGANSTVDRGTYGATRIGRGTKIDNLVQVAHNCNIGQHNLICSQVGIAGSCSTGDYVVLAGQVGMRDHIHIGSRTMVGAQSGVASDIAEDLIVLGSPAIPRFEQAAIFAAINKLPEMRRTVKRLEKESQQSLQAKTGAPN
ncbi:MAG: UDP-3-O-(3-hydroxymyristoyl)glucosamine N-acyltransferase [Planctomycetes bacterium]|nr:UDP-3-O-(3-hydroxymyristoyl)glucosamine N-acyltransferase [Planctomycetota bacterium]